MSRRYCTKHPMRGNSHYRERLAKRGHPRTLMEPLERLRRMQGGADSWPLNMPGLDLRVLREERQETG